MRNWLSNLYSITCARTLIIGQFKVGDIPLTISMWLHQLHGMETKKLQPQPTFPMEPSHWPTFSKPRSMMNRGASAVNITDLQEKSTDNKKKFISRPMILDQGGT